MLAHVLLFSCWHRCFLEIKKTQVLKVLGLNVFLELLKISEMDVDEMLSLSA